MLMFLSLPLVLLSFLPAPSPADVVEQQILAYFVLIEERESAPPTESLWSLAQYYMEGEDHRDILMRTGRKMDIDWISWLDPEDPDPLHFYEIARHFEDERLLLYLLLNAIPTEELRESFDQFYQTTSRDELKDLNRRIAEGETISLDHLKRHRYDFSTFLILYYPDRFTTAEENLTELLAQLLSDQVILYQQVLEPHKRDFLLASQLIALYDNNNYSPIVASYQQFSDLSWLPRTEFKLSLYWALDYVMYRAGHIDKSLEIQREHTIPIAQQTKNFSSLNAILAAHGANLYTLGKYNESREVYLSALSDNLNQTPINQTRLYNNLSLVYYKLGDNNNYIETQLKALEVAISEDSYTHQLNIYRNLHIYYRNNNNWDLALSYIQEARRIAEAIANKDELASIIISQSVYFSNFLNDHDTALSLLQEARLLLDATADYRLQVRVLYEKAKLYTRTGRPDKSREIYYQVKALGAENNNDRMYLEALVDLADIETGLGNFEKGRQLISEFKQHDVTVVDFHVLVNARRLEAGLAAREGRFSQAEQVLRYVADQVLARSRATTDPEAGYWHIEQSYLKLFQLYADLLSRQNRLADLLNLLDQFKTINDASLTDNPLIHADVMSEEELAESLRLTEQLDDMRKTLLHTSEAGRLSIQSEIASLVARRNRLTRQPDAEMFRPQQLWTIQSQLESGEMILHTTQLLEDLYLILIDARDIRFMKLPFGDAQEEQFALALDGLATGQTDLMALHDIYRYLQLSSLPSHVTSLIVLPDSWLYQLPLDVLPIHRPETPTSYGQTRYLVEKMEVRYLNNLRELTHREPITDYKTDFTGIGISDFSDAGRGHLISLPQAPDEVRQIASRLDRVSSSRVYTESQGTLSAFREGAENSRILHLASHSEISESNPLFSRIYLYPESSSAGTEGSAAESAFNSELFAYQLHDMNLNNELIMLNSCDSGSGEYFQGTGVMGISRALRYAGAKSLILNSWMVNDHFASDFAVSFYSRMNLGRTKSRSMQEAKIHLLTTSNANPHFWGAYMLNGSNRPVVPRQGEWEVSIIVLLLFSTLLVASVMTRRYSAARAFR